MDMYPQYKSALGYKIGEDGVDSYGVNHNGFSTRDELEYQVARQQRENQLIQNYNNQGITQDYPQQGTEFWGSNTDNFYSFSISSATSLAAFKLFCGLNSADFSSSNKTAHLVSVKDLAKR